MVRCYGRPVQRSSPSALSIISEASPIYVPVALFDQIEHLRRQITLWRLQREGNPRVPLHRVIEVAIRDAKLQERLDRDTQNPAPPEADSPSEE